MHTAPAEQPAQCCSTSTQAPAARIAIDIGGTKIAAGVVTDADPTVVLHRTTRPTHAQDGAEVVMSHVLAAVDQAMADAHADGLEVSSIGVGAPGVVDPERGDIAYAGPTMPGWAGTDVAARIRKAVDRPVAIHNDVRVMGLGEAVYGAGAGVDDVLFVSIGTGIGGAFIAQGRIPASPHHSRGEIAYAPCPTPEGTYSTLESVGAGPKLSAAYCRAIGEPEDSLALPEVMRRYHAGDAQAQEIIQTRMRCVGQGLAGLVAAVDASAIILGGGVGTLGDVITRPLSEGLRAHLLPYQQGLPLMVAQLGTNAPLVGAAELARTHAR